MAMITDSDIKALITPEIQQEVIDDIVCESVVLKHFTRLPNRRLINEKLESQTLFLLFTGLKETRDSRKLRILNGQIKELWPKNSQQLFQLL